MSDVDDFELCVKPILEEMGLYEGNEVSVKKAFEKYIKAFPDGVGPFSDFKGMLEDELCLDTKILYDEGIATDYLCSYNKKKDMLDKLLRYDPRGRRIKRYGIISPAERYSN